MLTQKKILLLLFSIPLIMGFTPLIENHIPPEELEPPVLTIWEEVALLEELVQLRELERDRLIEQQEHLQDLGWYDGEVNGIRGPLIEEAIEEFAEFAELNTTTPRAVLGLLRSGEAPTPPPPPVPPAPKPTPAPEPEPTPEPDPTPPATTSSSDSIPSHWIRLAECESGEWDANAQPILGSARWDYGAPGAFSRPGYPFHGGLNFHPDTWTWVAPMVGLGHIAYAYQATPQEQVRVGEKVQQLQTWNAWPVCSRKIGLL